jgi:DNA-binding MarR family transcriptional regulator
MSESRGPYDPTGDQTEDIGLALRHTWQTLIRGALSHSQADQLGKQAYWVLAATAKEPRRMADLAEIAEVSSASLTGIVDRLEERGFVIRARSDEDRRVVTAHITDAGRECVRSTHEEFQRRLAAMLSPLTAAERTELARLFTKMHDQKGL